MAIKNVLANVSKSISKKMGMTGLKIREAKPELLLVFGIVTMGGAIVTAVMAGRKHDAVIDQHLSELELAKAEVVVVEAAEDTDQNDISGDVSSDGQDLVRTRSDKEIKKAITWCYIHTLGRFVRLYALPTGLAIVSGYSFIKMHNDQAATIARGVEAYMGVKTAFDLYQTRNIELNGVDNHNMCKFGYKEVEVTEEDPDNGEVYTIKKKVPLNSEEAAKELIANSSNESLLDDETTMVTSDKVYLVYARNTSPEHRGIASLDAMHLQAAEKYLRDLLNVRGWVVVNDVCDELKIDRTDEGRDLGWVKGCGPELSLGWDTTMAEMNSRFLAGYNDEPVVLELNIHGNVNWLRKKYADDMKARKGNVVVEGNEGIKGNEGIGGSK